MGWFCFHARRRYLVLPIFSIPLHCCKKLLNIYLAVQEAELARADETLADAQRQLDEKKAERDAAQKEYDDAMRYV